MKKRIILISALAVAFIASMIIYSQWIKPLLEFDEGEGTVMVETQEGETLGTQLRYQIFPKIAREDLSSVKVTNEYGEFEFYKKDGELMLRGSEGTAINGETLSELVVAAGYPLALLKVAPDAEGYEEYGLNDPVCTWTITANDGTSHTLHVGHKVHTGEGYYVCMDGRDAVYVLSNSLEEPLMSPVTVFVTPVVMAAATHNDYYTIDKLVISRLEDDALKPFVSFAHTPEEDMMNPDAIAEMQVVYPAKYIASETEIWNVCMLMTGLSGDYTAAIGATEETYAEFGLDNAAHMISFEYNGDPYYVIASEKLEDGGYYATSSMNPTVISHVDGETLKFLEYDLFKWISPYAFGHYITQITNITVPRGEAEVSFDLEHYEDGSGNGGLDVTCSAGKSFTTEEQIWNFRLFFRTLIGVEMIDYVPLTEAERRELTSDEANLMFYFDYTTLSGRTTRIGFWPYSTRRCLVTFDGEGEFYVLIDRVEKLISDVEKVMTDVDIDSFAKD